MRSGGGPMQIWKVQLIRYPCMHTSINALPLQESRTTSYPARIVTVCRKPQQELARVRRCCNHTPSSKAPEAEGKRQDEEADSRRLFLNPPERSAWFTTRDQQLSPRCAIEQQYVVKTSHPPRTMQKKIYKVRLQQTQFDRPSKGEEIWCLPHAS